MHIFELTIGLLALIAVLAWLADRIAIPYPMLMLLGGAIFAVIPWTPIIDLDPELTLVLFLPPILLQAASTTLLRDFRWSPSSSGSRPSPTIPGPRPGKPMTLSSMTW